MENVTKINWFPGHMKKSLAILQDKVKYLDLIIHVVDSRAINITSNDNIFKEIGYYKPIIKVALKSDLSLNNKDEQNLIFGNIYDKNFKNKIIKKIFDVLAYKNEFYKKKQLVNPKFYIAVVGLPNVGKSSLINFLAHKKQLKVQNIPGLTKKQTWVQIHKNLFLLDTPGILFKNICNIEHGYILVLLKCIKWDVVPKNKVIEFAFNFFKNKYQTKFWAYFETDFIKEYQAFLVYVCTKYHLYKKNHEFDFDLCIEKLYNIFTNNFLGKINFE